MATKDVTVNGQVYPCPMEWTVDQAEGRVRSKYQSDNVPLLGTARISSTNGSLNFVGGVSQQGPAAGPGGGGGSNSVAVWFHTNVKHKRHNLNLKYVTDLNSLVSAIQSKWPAFKIMEYELSFANPSTHNTEVVTQAALQLHNNQTLNITVKSRCLGSGDYANKKAEALAVAGVAFTDSSLLVTDDAIFPLAAESDIEEAAKNVQVELAKRVRAINVEETSEYTKREFISPLLIAAVCVCNVSKKMVNMICEKSVVGKYGRGSIDYALLFKRIFIFVTEAKKEDMKGGEAQNIVQQGSGRESLANAFVPFNAVGEARKQKFDEVYDVIRTIPTFGIVTTGSQWRFTMVDHSRVKTRVAKSSTFDLLLHPTADPAQQGTQLQNIQAILRRIVGMLQRLMEQVNKHAHVRELLESVDPTGVERKEAAFLAMADSMDTDNKDEEVNSEEDEEEESEDESEGDGWELNDGYNEKKNLGKRRNENGGEDVEEMRWKRRGNKE